MSHTSDEEAVDKGPPKLIGNPSPIEFATMTP
jgi:hypothetical protein